MNESTPLTPAELSHTQIELTELIRRFNVDRTPCAWGPYRLTPLTEQDKDSVQTLSLSREGSEVPVELTRSEYVIVWALMGVSRSGEHEGGYLTTAELDAVLTGIVRESRNTDERDIALRTLNTAQQLVHQINGKLSAVFGSDITIANERTRGYYLLRSDAKDI